MQKRRLCYRLVVAVEQEIWDLPEDGDGQQRDIEACDIDIQQHLQHGGLMFAPNTMEDGKLTVTDIELTAVVDISDSEPRLRNWPASERKH